MSALWGLSVGGAITLGSGPVVSYRNGLPMNAAGQLVAVNGGIIVGHSQGIPVDAANEVCYDIAGAIAGYSCGLPFTATGQLACGVGTGTLYSSNVPFLVNGKVAIN